MPDGDYIYELITNEHDARACARLIADEFTAHNPITTFDQLTPAHFFEQTAWPAMHDMFAEQLSFLARHRTSGEVVAATIAGDLYLHQQRKHRSTVACAIAVDALIDELDELFVSRDFGQELHANVVVYAPLMAVRSSHAGRGILVRMLQILCDHARQSKCFQYMLVQVTHQATRHIFINKFGGREGTTIDPTTWLWQRKGTEPTYPYKEYTGGLIPNILVKL